MNGRIISGLWLRLVRGWDQGILMTAGFEIEDVSIFQDGQKQLPPSTLVIHSTGKRKGTITFTIEYMELSQNEEIEVDKAIINCLL